MGVAVLAQLHHDPAPPHLVRHCARSAGTGKGVKDEVTGVGGDFKDAADEPFRLWGLEHFGIFRHSSHDFLLGFLCIPYFFVQPHRLRDYAIHHFTQKPLEAGHIVTICPPPDATVGIQFSKLCGRNHPVPPLRWASHLPS